jgi:hypothetical protein
MAPVALPGAILSEWLSPQAGGDGHSGVVAVTDVIDATLPRSFNTLADSGEDNRVLSDDEHSTTDEVIQCIIL